MARDTRRCCATRIGKPIYFKGLPYVQQSWQKYFMHIFELCTFFLNHMVSHVKKTRVWAFEVKF